MIALTSCVGKIFHQIVADRIEKFAISNNLIDPAMQKAFLKGINGCTENNQVIHELLSDAKKKNKTIHMTFFDLQDAFGSVEHNLLHYALELYNFPPEIRSYIRNLYSRLQGHVRTQQWSSSQFSFRRGVFQGDPLSPLMFLLVFNPVLSNLKTMEDRYGYALNDTRFISVPFADDFNLITSNKRTHQRLLNEISSRLESMNLNLKPAKCWSISICSGKPTKVEFEVQGNPINPIGESPKKYLGSIITFNLKSAEVASFVREKLKTILENINASRVRDEYKVAVFTRYSLPSLRYLLSVHDLTNTQLDDLDGLVIGQLKKWLNIPKHGATPSILFSRDGLQFRLPSDIYKESHILSHASSRLRADTKVQAVLDAKVDRESKWSRKMSLANASVCEKYYEQCNTSNWLSTRKQVKDTLNSESRDFWREKIQPLVFQGDFLKLVALEEGDLTWRSIIFDLPKGVLSFLARAAINSLPTSDNLKRWGMKLNTQCKLCGNHETLCHILNSCSIALEQERFNYRHDSILNHIVSFIKNDQKDCLELYADLPDCTVNGGTIPSDIVVTVERPDIVIIDRKERVVEIGELTVPFEPNLESARKRKEEKYAYLVADIESKGFKCTLTCFEVGSRGLITKDNKRRINRLMKLASHAKKTHDHIKQTSKIAVLTSYAIFNARRQPIWTMPKLLSIVK